MYFLEINPLYYKKSWSYADIVWTLRISIVGWYEFLGSYASFREKLFHDIRLIMKISMFHALTICFSKAIVFVWQINISHLHSIYNDCKLLMILLNKKSVRTCNMTIMQNHEYFCRSYETIANQQQWNNSNNINYCVLPRFYHPTSTYSFNY